MLGVPTATSKYKSIAGQTVRPQNRAHQARDRVDIRNVKVPLVLRDRVIGTQTLRRQDTGNSLERDGRSFGLFSSILATGLSRRDVSANTSAAMLVCHHLLLSASRTRNGIQTSTRKLDGIVEGNRHNEWSRQLVIVRKCRTVTDSHPSVIVSKYCRTTPNLHLQIDSASMT